MIEVDGVDAIVAACAQLSEAAAAERAGAVERNFAAARSYAGDFGHRLQLALEPCFPSSGTAELTMQG